MFSLQIKINKTRERHNLSLTEQIRNPIIDILNGQPSSVPESRDMAAPEQTYVSVALAADI